MKLYNEVKKNFTLIFRNWSSLFLIIIAPLLLILLVGYSFSGTDLHDIKIGTVTENFDVSAFAKNISNYASVTQYNNIDDCIFNMKKIGLHLCLEITNTDDSEIPTGNVNFYYDNTRKKTTLLVLNQLKEFFGLSSERISLISTQTIIDNIQQLLNFINMRIDDIEQVMTEAENIKTDLQERKENLIKVKDDYEPKFILIKEYYNQLENYTDKYNKTNTEFITNLDNITQSLIKIRDNINYTIPEININDSLLNITNTTLGNVTINKTINISKRFNTTNPLTLAIDSLIKETNDLKNSSNDLNSQVGLYKTSISGIVNQLQDINKTLYDEINRTGEYVILIKESQTKINDIIIQAKNKMKDLSKIDPSLAAKIVKPITQSFNELLKNVKDIQITFPALLSTIIIFISMLFSNIITLIEINDKAFVRNIISPVDDLYFTFGMAITNAMIISFQVIVLLVVAQYTFGIDIVSNLLPMIILMSVLIITFVFFGMIIAYMAKNMQTSILISTFIALGFFLFSDVVNALEAMPILASKIAYYNPIVLSNSLLRKIIFFSQKGFSNELGVLITYMILSCITLIYISKKKNKERF